MSETEIFNFEGCKFLKYNDKMSVPRQGIHFGAGVKALCYARFDFYKKLELVQYCKRGRMNNPECGITIRCCSDFEATEHSVEVPIWELNSSPRNFEQLQTCNQMCLLSEWDESKPRDCENCSGIIK